MWIFLQLPKTDIFAHDYPNMATVYPETGVQKMRRVGGSLSKSLGIERKTLF